jgi:cytoskeletal protein CcmA (bactofilin family)
MFRRDQRPDEAAANTPAAPAGSPHPPQRTLVARGSRVDGLLGGSADLEIEGEVHGEIKVDAMVLVGPNGLVEAPVQARVVRVAGKVRGPVRATERVEILASGSLEGDVAAPRVTIAEGAFVKGKVEMGKQQPQ